MLLIIDYVLSAQLNLEDYKCSTHPWTRMKVVVFYETIDLNIRLHEGSQLIKSHGQGYIIELMRHIHASMRPVSDSCKLHLHAGIYRTLAKNRPWAVHLTLGSNWGVGEHSRNHRCILTCKSAQVYTCM